MNSAPSRPVLCLLAAAWLLPALSAIPAERPYRSFFYEEVLDETPAGPAAPEKAIDAPPAPLAPCFPEPRLSPVAVPEDVRPDAWTRAADALLWAPALVLALAVLWGLAGGRRRWGALRRLYCLTHRDYLHRERFWRLLRRELGLPSDADGLRMLAALPADEPGIRRHLEREAESYRPS